MAGQPAGARLGIAVLASLVPFTLRARDLWRVVAEMHGSSLVIAWPPILVVLALPWILGGADPGQDAFTAAILVAGAVAFGSTTSRVLLAFGLSSVTRRAGESPDRAGSDEEA